MKHLLYILILGLTAVGCTSVDCSVNGRVTCNFSVQTEDGETDTIPYCFSVIVTRSIDDNDTTIINLQGKTTSFSLPMPYDGSEVEYYLNMKDTTTVGGTGTDVTDIMTITKNNSPYFEDVDCAPRYNHTIEGLQVTSNFIEDMEVKNTKVTNEGRVNVIVTLKK